MNLRLNKIRSIIKKSLKRVQRKWKWLWIKALWVRANWKCTKRETTLWSCQKWKVLDQNQVHWLSDGNCLNIREIVRLLRYKVVNKVPRFDSTGSNLWIGLGEFTRLILYADYLVLAKADSDIYLYKGLLKKADVYTFCPITK